MPIYEFVCTGCQREFETLVVGASAEVSCPGCGSADVERCLSVFGVQRGQTTLSGTGPVCPQTGSPGL